MEPGPRRTCDRMRLPRLWGSSPPAPAPAGRWETRSHDDGFSGCLPSCLGSGGVVLLCGCCLTTPNVGPRRTHPVRWGGCPRGWVLTRGLSAGGLAAGAGGQRRCALAYAASVGSASPAGGGAPSRKRGCWWQPRFFVWFGRGRTRATSVPCVRETSPPGRKRGESPVAADDGLPPAVPRASPSHCDRCPAATSSRGHLMRTSAWGTFTGGASVWLRIDASRRRR